MLWSVVVCSLLGLMQLTIAVSPTPQWGIYEITLPEVEIVFSNKNSALIRVRGFYDGENTFKIRFMPQIVGDWSYTTDSNLAALKSINGTFVVTGSSGNGPVRVRNTRSFEYSDGSDHFSVGTTSYAWIHQNDTMIQNTIKTLSSPSCPFNKMRMTSFPKWYWFNKVEPIYFPYQGTPLTNWDFTQFNVSFWKRYDQRIHELASAGVQADIILFHPYDNGHWGFDCMGGRDANTYDTSNDELYLRYIVARLGAFANVWWSMANEWDLVKCKSRGLPQSSPTWDRLFEVLAFEDPYNHLTSIHNCVQLYNHSRPWITHISSQGGYDMAHIKRRYAPKPIVWDEVMYEGDIGNWGGLTAGQMTDRFWWALSYGIYAGHGETVLYKSIKDEDQVLWWSKGNILRGNSPSRIQWFKELASKYFDSFTCSCTGWGSSMCDASCLNEYSLGDGINLVTDEKTVYFLHSSGYNVPPHPPTESILYLPEGEWALQPVDFWNMKILPPTVHLHGGVGIKSILTGSMLTFESLTNNDTLVPCKRSGASCCSNDTHSCTPYIAMLAKQL